MSDNENAPKKRGNFTAIVVLLAIVVGLLIYYAMPSIVVAICVPILIIGAYEIASSFSRSTQADRFGTSDSGAALFWGFLFVAIGGAGIIHSQTGNIIFAVVFFLVMLIFYFLAKRYD